ncbi:hypothetical protein A8C75_11155 [Marinobacterium aestuarii]|uniref:Uncharacterized protein n=1 Tax=Marinobacterium aestuarii TaxID=1821621 RepID=A0A1A9EZC1_9GAMM|nr:DUF4144 family protein [Marinobacterium aestuarii]ANG62988.1 hypothetical protein A8C75_11155 [Marinobacterium aestuarii]
MTTDNILFPALVQHQDDAELSFIASPEDWARCALEAHFYRGVQPGDRLIDSQGRVYWLCCAGAVVKVERSDELLSLPQVLALVRGHAALQNNCCAGKLGARDFSEAIHLVAHLTD